MTITLFDSSSQNNKPQPRKRVGGVRRRNKTKNQFRGRMDGTTQPNDNSDIDAVFRGVQQTRTKVHKGLSGMPLNPDGTDPGNSFDRFMRQNPHLSGAAQRQAQYDQQARAELQGRLQSAIAERKALQEMQQYNPNLITDANGYRTIFDSKGGVIGTTAPVKSGFSGYKGETAADAQNAFNRGEGTDAERGIFRRNLQQTGLDSVAGKIKKPTKSSGIDAIFGGAKQTSPSGVAGGGVVEPPQPKGAPGGELFRQEPGLRPPKGMTAYGPTYPPNAGPQYDYTMAPNSGPQYTPMMPNDGPQRPIDFGPQLPSDALRNSRDSSMGYADPANYGEFVPNQQQQVAINRLQNLGNTQFRLSDLYPGNDYTYLEQLFPGFKFSDYRTPNLALDALRALVNKYSPQSAVVPQLQRGR